MATTCEERIATTRGVRPALAAATSSSSTSTTSLLIRTSGATTLGLANDRCSREYISLLQRELRGVADVHILTDVSSWAPGEATAEDTRAWCDAHERAVARVVPSAASVMAFTVVDVLQAFPHVLSWPTPGDAAWHPIRSYPDALTGWLRHIRSKFRSQGNLTRRVYPSPTGPTTASDGPATVSWTASNMVSYLIHEPSLCLWLRRRAAHRPPLPLPSFVWAIEEDTPFLGALREPLLHYASSRADYIGVCSSTGTPMVPALAQLCVLALCSLWHTCILCCVCATPQVLMPHRSISQSNHHLYSNDAFRSVYPNIPIHKWEHTQRFSHRLLTAVDDSLTAGQAAFGEVFASTVCAHAPEWCSCADLRDSGYVQRQGRLYAWSAPIKRSELRRLLEQGSKPDALDDARGRRLNRWLHSVDGSCDVLATALCAAREHVGERCILPNRTDADRSLFVDRERFGGGVLGESNGGGSSGGGSNGGGSNRGIHEGVPPPPSPRPSDCEHSTSPTLRPRVFWYPSPIAPYTRTNAWRLGFLSRLFRLSRHYTTRGECADFFFIANQERTYARGERRSTSDVGAMLSELIHKWQWWNATNGHRHFLSSPCDHGPRDCMYSGRHALVPPSIQPRSRNRTLGYLMLSGDPSGALFQRLNDIRLPTPEGHTCGPFCGMSEAVRSNHTAATLLLRGLSPWTRGRSAAEAEVMVNERRPITLFFAGRLIGQSGMRALIFRHHARTPGFVLHDTSGRYPNQPQQSLGSFAGGGGGPAGTSYAAAASNTSAPNWFVHSMARATFCYSPLGGHGGDSDRYLPAVLYGCIPIFCDDDVPPLAQVIRWERFAILNVRASHLPHLHETLANISHERIVEMRRAMSEEWPRLLWTSALRHGLLGRPRAASAGSSIVLNSYLGEDADSDAYASLLEVLRRRMGKR